MRLLSLDCSTKSTGYAIFDDNDNKLESFGCITASSTDLIKRIDSIIVQIENILKTKEIEHIVMEEVRPEKGKNMQTYKALMWLQAAINFLVHEHFPKVKIEYLYPSSWRKDCGIKTGAGIKREALKQADIDFVRLKYGISDVNDDEADAIGIGHAYINKNG